jgi:hypothetical protein
VFDPSSTHLLGLRVRDLSARERRRWHVVGVPPVDRILGCVPIDRNLGRRHEDGPWIAGAAREGGKRGPGGLD